MKTFFKAAALVSLALPTYAWSETLTVAVTNLPPVVDPSARLGNTNVNGRIAPNVLERLMTLDAKGEPQPQLATAWRRIDDRTLELDIRSGVTCHDGSPFDATDVEFSFGPARLRGEEAPGAATANQFLGGIESVTAVGTNKVVVTTKAADPILEKRLGNWMAEVICQEPYEAAGDFDTWGRAVVGTGPYKLGTFDPTSEITLERFDGYWGQPAPVEQVSFKRVPEFSARVAGLTTGEFDIITEITPDQVGTINAIDGATSKGGAIDNIRVLVFDHMNPVLADLRIRKALSLAIDRQLIAEQLFLGETEVPEGLQSKSFGDLYIDGVGQPPYDPAKARELLAEAGYDGAPIPYRILQNYYANEVATAEILQAMWADVGLNVELQVKENLSQLVDPAGRGIGNWSNTIYFSDPSGSISRNYGKAGLLQRIKFFTQGAEGFNETAAKLDSSLDFETRKAAFEQLVRQYRDDVIPGTPLHMLTAHYGVSDKIEWTPGSTAEMRLGADSLTLNK